MKSANNSYSSRLDQQVRESDLDQQKLFHSLKHDVSIYLESTSCFCQKEMPLLINLKVANDSSFPQLILMLSLDCTIAKKQETDTRIHITLLHSIHIYKLGGGGGGLDAFDASCVHGQQTI